MGVVLVLKETGMGVFLQLLRVLHEQVVELGLLHLPPGPQLTVVQHVDLQKEGGAIKERKRREGEDG